MDPASSSSVDSGSGSIATVSPPPLSSNGGQDSGCQTDINNAFVDSPASVGTADDDKSLVVESVMELAESELAGFGPGQALVREMCNVVWRAMADEKGMRKTEV